MKSKVEIYQRSKIEYLKYVKYIEAFNKERIRLNEQMVEEIEKAELLSSAQIIHLLKKDKLWGEVSKDDRKLIKRSKFNWNDPFDLQVLLTLKTSICAAKILHWCIGLSEQPVSYITQPKPEKCNLPEFDDKSTIISETEITKECDIAAVIHWRLIEGIDERFDKEPFPSIIKRVFDGELGETLSSYAEQLPMKNNDLLILTPNGKQRVNEADNFSIFYTRLMCQSYQKALEWVLNDETWENTVADT